MDDDQVFIPNSGWIVEKMKVLVWRQPGNIQSATIPNHVAHDDSYVQSCIMNILRTLHALGQRAWKAIVVEGRFRGWNAVNQITGIAKIWAVFFN